MVSAYYEQEGHVPASVFELPDYALSKKSLCFYASEDNMNLRADWVIVVPSWTNLRVFDKIVLVAPAPSEMSSGQRMRLVVFGSGAVDYLPEEEFLERIQKQVEDY